MPAVLLVGAAALHYPARRPASPHASLLHGQPPVTASFQLPPCPALSPRRSRSGPPSRCCSWSSRLATGRRCLTTAPSGPPCMAPPPGSAPAVRRAPAPAAPACLVGAAVKCACTAACTASTYLLPLPPLASSGPRQDGALRPGAGPALVPARRRHHAGGRRHLRRHAGALREPAAPWRLNALRRVCSVRDGSLTAA